MTPKVLTPEKVRRETERRNVRHVNDLEVGVGLLTEQYAGGVLAILDSHEHLRTERDEWKGKAENERACGLLTATQLAESQAEVARLRSALKRIGGEDNVRLNCLHNAEIIAREALSTPSPALEAVREAQLALCVVQSLHGNDPRTAGALTALNAAFGEAR